MKHFKNLSVADSLLLIVPLALVVPNCYISMLSGCSFAEWTASILLPAGIYMLLMAISKNTPRSAVMMFPLMFLGAFQIVVSYLYCDGSPIGVDMFLNVETTNIDEVNELLSSICGPVAFVAALYLPLLIISIIKWHRHQKADNHLLPIFRKAGLIIATAGMATTLYLVFAIPQYRISTRIFPINALHNLKEAFIRQVRTDDYSELSDDFSYGAASQNKENEIYIAVIGETARADNWQILGYDRPTNPELSLYGDSLLAFGNVFSESNTTHKSVPMLLTTLSSETFKENIYRHKSIISAFKEAGFHTAFISVQKPNKSFIDFYAQEADTLSYIKGNGNLPAFDEKVLPQLDAFIADKSHGKKLIVIHLYGSHYDYSDRYPPKYSLFLPDSHMQANYRNRQKLLNAYDNTIVYTDHLLAELISRIKSIDCNAALIYTSDHGEDIFDDSRKKYLHASPVPTYWQLHVPLIIYMNPAYLSSHPEFAANALGNRKKLASSSKSFPLTLLHLAGISSRYSNPTQSLLYKGFIPLDRLHFLNDLNECADLYEWGFTNQDMAKIRALGNL